MKRPDNNDELSDWQNGPEREPAEAPVTVDAVDVPLERFWRVIGWPGSHEEGGAFMDDVQSKRAPKESTTGTLAAALAKAQSQIKGATKDSTNPAFQSKTPNLASVWEACRRAVVRQREARHRSVPARPTPDAVVLVTRLLHVSGESVLERDALPIRNKTCRRSARP